MGTPDFASACLRSISEKGMDVAAVITQPDRKQGRGMKVAFSDVKKTATELGIPVYQPDTLKDGAILPLLDEIKPDVIVVVAYGKILPEYVLNFPKYGCVNVHGSLLPKYRGAAPIQRAVLDGEKVTGITTMLMDKGLDTGDMLLTKEYEIGENETVGEVFDALSAIGGELLTETLIKLEEGSIKPVKQDEEGATYAQKITNEECLVDFGGNALNVHNKIRGMSPYPGSYAYLDGKVVKLYDSRIAEKEYDGKPGEVVDASAKGGVVIKCGSGAVRVLRFKPEGKGVMSAADMINGRKIAVGKIFE